MWYMHLPFKIKQYKKNNERNLARIRKKDKITVVFFASNVAMWRYQGLFEEMQKDGRYNAYIVLSPLYAGYSKEQRIDAVFALRKYFDEKGVSYFDYDTEQMKGYDVHSLNPDILFYAQPYFTIMQNKHRFYHFKNCLLCYYPYGFYYQNVKSFYDDIYQCKAWKLFHENEYAKEGYRLYSPVGDYNVDVVGYPNVDMLVKSCKDVWKPQTHTKKRIIWAPHFTIRGDGWAQNSEFLNIADFMLQIKNEYKDLLQFAFKPHPKLLSELYKHPEWGKEITDAYYKEWAEGENSQFENGEYINLFVSSDAMIHDSGSFAAEYLFTGNPVLYTCNDMESLYKNANTCGKMVYDSHYHGGRIDDIKNFIENVVLKGKDGLKGQRLEMREKCLIPPHGKTVARNTMDILNKELFNNI